MSQRPPLFRQQALDFRQQRQWGEVIALQPLPIRLLFLGLAVMVVLLGAFLAQAQYARKETVPGYLAPKAGLVRVFPPRPGTVEVLKGS
jgi:membrane fusion protein